MKKTIYIKENNNIMKTLIDENQKLKEELSSLRKHLKWISSLTRESFSQDMIDEIRNNY